MIKKIVPQLFLFVPFQRPWNKSSGPRAGLNPEEKKILTFKFYLPQVHDISIPPQAPQHHIIFTEPRTAASMPTEVSLYSCHLVFAYPQTYSVQVSYYTNRISWSQGHTICMAKRGTENFYSLLWKETLSQYTCFPNGLACCPSKFAKLFIHHLNINFNFVSHLKVIKMLILMTSLNSRMVQA